ncbi:hypothetical protein DERP_002027 [Dermatophagoides pteronyssinus]|uniref:Uncharacterized protein n=1 Tax=Dermatophagoides pteronyssinus TaxID=6956 RepID=A0ABQ8JH57_DERPT|nr:hypothetical protein DERP_002027 [Dermatophagoides pteronyssinus]
MDLLKHLILTVVGGVFVDIVIVCVFDIPIGCIVEDDRVTTTAAVFSADEAVVNVTLTGDFDFSVTRAVVVAVGLTAALTTTGSVDFLLAATRAPLAVCGCSVSSCVVSFFSIASSTVETAFSVVTSSIVVVSEESLSEAFTTGVSTTVFGLAIDVATFGVLVMAIFFFGGSTFIGKPSGILTIIFLSSFASDF